jgi:hypothetical protein
VSALLKQRVRPSRNTIFLADNFPFTTRLLHEGLCAPAPACLVNFTSGCCIESDTWRCEQDRRSSRILANTTLTATRTVVSLTSR